MNDFDSELHEDLFKLIILVSNEWGLPQLIDEYNMNHFIKKLYSFQFNDRSLCDEEFEGWVGSHAYPLYYSGGQFKVAKVESLIHDQRIKFRFMSEVDDD